MADGTVLEEPENKAGLPPPAEKAPAFSGEVAFNENITIYTGNRLPLFDKAAAKAYAARGTGNAPPHLYAIICEDHLTPRILKVSSYVTIMGITLSKLVASGPIDWPSAGKQKYCFIFENNLGNPLMVEDTKGGLGLKPELVLNNFIRPMISLFMDMRDKDFIHGNIRLANIYDGNSRGYERFVLGECLSTPVSYNQPVLYEPIERAMASPSGRGVGTQQDDLYSFGVCLAIMMRHTDPMEGLSDEEIIERKLEEGTYACVAGKDRFNGAILEILRGLLYDDKAQRWTLEEVLAWLDGRRLTPKQAVRKLKANRPLPFNGEKYIRPEFLARDLNKNVGELRQLVENGEMEQWLSRALEDKLTNARYESALKLSEDGGKGAGYNERLGTRVAIALHPEGPMRYKSIKLLPDGLGTALTESYVMKRDLQGFIDFMMNYFITQWVDAQMTSVPDVSSIISKFDSARAFLRQKGLGGGIERCLYVLDPEIHCLSDKVQKFNVRSPEDLIHAYEKMSKLPGRPAMFFDRHIIAFLSAKERKHIDPYLHDLNAPEPYRRILAEIKCLATIQKRSQMDRMPGIASWMLDNLEPVYERFHDRELRVEIRKKAERLKDSGDLAKIVMLFDNPTVYQEDNTAFRRAMRTFHDLENETLQIEDKLRDEGSLGRNTGRQFAALAAAILAAIIILVTVFTGFTQSTKIF